MRPDIDNLIERLRKLIVLDEVGSNNTLANEAADEIERLQSVVDAVQRENEELRKAIAKWRFERIRKDMSGKWE